MQLLSTDADTAALNFLTLAITCIGAGQQVIVLPTLVQIRPVEREGWCVGPSTSSSLDGPVASAPQAAMPTAIVIENKENVRVRRVVFMLRRNLASAECGTSPPPRTPVHCISSILSPQGPKDCVLRSCTGVVVKGCGATEIF